MTYAEYMQRLKTAEDQIKKVKFDQKKLEKEIKYQKDLIEDINKKLGKEDPLLAQQRDCRRQMGRNDDPEAHRIYKLE